MAKEILFYSPIYSSTVSDYIRELEANKNTDIKVRMNTPGGDVYAAYGAIAKFDEHKGGKSIQVDGAADSGGAYMCFAARCSGNEVNCLDVSQFLIHRAAMAEWIESDPKRFTDAMKKEVTTMNKGLRAMIEKVCNSQKFFEVTGYSLDAVFSMETRLDVQLDAEQAKSIGLVSNIMPLTAAMKNEVFALANRYGIAAFNNKVIPNINKSKVMTIKEFKEQNPEAYKEFKDKTINDTLKAERDRIEGWEQWRDIDAKKVEKAIKDGDVISTTNISAFSRKALAKGGLQAIEADKPADTTTNEIPLETPTKTAAEIANDKLLAEARKVMGLTK